MTGRALLVRTAALACAATLLCATPASAQKPPRPDSAARDTAGRDSLPAVLIGHVLDSAGAGIPGAEITLLKSDRIHAITGDSGQFRIANLPPGTVVFNVRRIGFEAATFTALLHPGKTHRANFRLSANAQALPTVNVADTAVQTHWLDAFNNRKASARGTFITRADIVKKGARNAVDAVRSVPGIRLEPTRGNGSYRVVMTRGAGARTCLPTMYVHGMPYSGTLDDFTADDVEALEIYIGISEIPPEFDKNGRGICGVIVVWTRDPRKAP